MPTHKVGKHRSSSTTFFTHLRPAREKRNPMTGEMEKIPAHRKPKFKPSQILREAVNKYNKT